MEEILDIVNESDVVIGTDTKQNKFSKELISRNVAVFLKDSHGNYTIIQRAPTKKSFPNRLDAAACGNVSAGESYEEAAAREIQEELGISCKIRFLKRILNEFDENGKKLRYFTGIFLGTFDGTLRLNEEAANLQKMEIEKLRKMVRDSPKLFTPGFVKDFLEVEKLL